MKTFVIQSKEVLARLVAYIEAQPAKPLLEVTVKEYHKDRTLAQNRLYWDWVTVISNELGLTKEDEHKDLKKRMLVPIYERDDESYAAMIQAVRKVHKLGHHQEAKDLADKIVDLTSTTDASVKQFTEYLNEIERDMMGKGIALPHPEDRYYTAMGIKQAA